MNNYTLKQIRTFLEVAREGSVSKAASRLCVTQPAVSMQLRQLEDAFGVALIEASGRRIKLTDAGESFLTHATEATAHLKNLESVMAEHVGVHRGSINLAVVSTAKYFIPMLLVRFGKLFPGVEISLSIENREKVLNLLAHGEADLVVMGRAPKALECEAIPFATNPLSIVATPDHPLSRRRHIPFSELGGYAFVVRESGSGTRAAMERLFAQNDLQIKVSMEMPSNETIKQAVMAGMGLSFLSLRTVRHELASGRLALLDVSGMPLVGNWFVTHLRQKRLSPAAKAFKHFLIEQAGPLIDTWS